MKVKVDHKDPDTYVVSKLNNKKYARITHTHLKKYNMTIDEYCSKYNLSNCDIICKKLRESLSFTKEHCIKKYGDIDGILKWEAYRKQQALTNSYEYKKKKYNMTLEEFSTYNKNRSVTLHNLIKRHGDVDGLVKWKLYCEKQAKAGCSLEYFIEKYGDADGPVVYDQVCKSKSNSIASYIERYGKTEGVKRYNSKISEQSVGYSKISQELFKILASYTSNNVFFAESVRGSEYHILDIENKRSYFYDYVDFANKKCIEFNGDVFHGNPSMFSELDTPNPFSKITCSKLWEYDSIKIECIKKLRDIDTLVVWENDFRKDREGVIKKCLEFLKYEC